ncbi:disulfide bond formation protein DsbD (plasmid) [Burkholderia thailandensis]|uniref:protein-disulfide reductase DsbD domain-containing protein n=1 Tax=Burkholderia thailandensis TaxID=57975 RepID=UPI00192D219C|nr:protein-disulfide reductase DsbD domain-containing protein [Burkholderia thailandensis]MBS2132143.1 disulfide bond formation protein DsbD [Burkholderia thailandensis]QRA15248.1 disulfide bond formation protein DsbD [Burkholderia thailandensis]
MKTNLRPSVIILLFLAVVGAGPFAWSQYRQHHAAANSGNSRVQNAPSQALPVSAPGGIGDSSQEVSASVKKVGHDAVVTLHIRPEWHVNANPASLDYLIPTTISVEQNGTSHPAGAHYPPGRDSGIRVDERELQVYDDGTRIPVTDLPERPGSRLIIDLQACSSEGVCLPPAHIIATESTP